jgi:hypothetical protein
MTIFAAALLTVWAAAAYRALAAETVVDGVSIRLPVPAGFCELTASNPSDKKMIDAMTKTVAAAGGARLVAMSADCQQLVEWRKGKRLLADYAQYQMPRSPAASDDLLDRVCAEIRTHGAELVEKNREAVAGAMEAAIDHLKVDEQSFGGFLGRDSNGCYIAQIQKLTLNGKPLAQMDLLGITIVKGMLLAVNRYAVYVDAASIQNGYENLKTMVAAARSANKN